jgi:acid phosphatase family membrane protein YuiD
MDPFLEFARNGIFWTGIAGWFAAQTIKVVTGVFREKRFNFKWFLGYGGMPSSHTSGMSALTTAVGLSYGFDSVVFAISLAFTMIVMFDAQTVRMSTGKQAKILNQMLDDIYWKKKFDEVKLKEFLGHTPVEVFAGAALGIVVGLLLYK